MGYPAVATHYDERDFVFRATLDVASIRIRLRDPSRDLQDKLYSRVSPGVSP